MDDLNQRLFRTAIFLGKMIVAGLFFRVVLFVNPDTTVLQTGFASLIAGLLNIAGLEVTHSGIRILTEQAIYVIVQDCLGWKSMAVFIALVYASTSRALESLNFLLKGLGILFLANILRVFSTVYLAEIGLVSFEIIHGVLWRWSLTLVVLGLWLYWLRNLKDEEKVDERIKNRLDALNQS